MDETMPLSEVWARTFNRVKRDVDIPTVWLAMQAVRPIVIDGNRFIATIPADLRYLSMNLDSSDAAHAIEQALEEIAGHPLIFHLIEGETLADWESEKAELLGPSSNLLQNALEMDNSIGDMDWPQQPAGLTFDVDDGPFAEPRPGDPIFRDVMEAKMAPPPPAPAYAAPVQSPMVSAPEEGFDTWEKLLEYFPHDYKIFPNIKYAHGQAKYLLKAARMVSGTMDRLMPAPGEPVDNDKERQLAKAIERLGIMLTLDPLFVSLEVMRYRQMVGKSID